MGSRGPSPIVRFGGADRYSTSLLIADAVAAAAGGSVEQVVLVSGERWTDAVVAAPVAGALGAPVLMTPPFELRDDAAAFLQRIGATRALVLGPEAGGGGHGPGRGVSATVLSALADAGVSAERIAGSDRFGTSVAAARQIVAGEMPGLGRTAIVASGDVFADALVAGPFAARGNHPVLLSSPDELHADVVRYLSGAGMEHLVIVGGTAALGDAIEAAIIDMGMSVTRVAGTDRYDTAVKAAELVTDRYSDAAGKPCFTSSTVGITRARVPFDSFSAAPLLGELCAPLLLVDPERIPAGTAAYLDAARTAHGTVDLRVFGGNAAVSQTALDDYLAGKHLGSEQDLEETEDTDDAAPAAYPTFDGPRSDQTLLTVARGRTCMVRLDATVTCWGAEGRRERLTTASLTDVVALSSSDHTGYLALHACAVHADGTVSCWGDGSEGQLALGGAGNRYVPVKIPRIDDAADVALSIETTCVLHGDGGVSCWGANRQGGVGHRDTLHNQYTPARVPNLDDAVAISAGPTFFCVIHRDSGVSCWGGSFFDSPQRVRGLSQVSSLSVADDRACAATTGGEVFCWYLRGGRPGPSVKGLHDVLSVSAGSTSTCVVHRDGGVSCWGDNEVGQLGHGTRTSRTTPKRLIGISDAVEVGISLGSTPIPAHACALRRNGRVSCWGDNSVSQLGDGTTTQRTSPRLAMQFSPIPADEAPVTALEVLHSWMDEESQRWHGDYPWLKIAWDHIRDQVNVSASGAGGLVWRSCDNWHERGCEVVGMTMSQLSLGGVVHELLHVYDIEAGLAPPEAWGAVQLYFATKYPDCYARGRFPGGEVLADTVTHLMVPHAWLTYYESGGCPSLPDQPSTDDEQVVLAGLAGKVPEWYAQNITSSDEFWAAWRQAPSLRSLGNLAPEFGGLCSDDWVTYPLEPERFPPADANPFRDAGC
ncbi:cell wall-binding repeat-containing protein [Candidatus Poriferisodalis sp.]|uniref:cell wall-binding repeat-containing protein n=1 Tax=Candidatus Poriferisodalis sp. TaxID=3101277 RepID=UPI003C7024A4